MTIIAAANLANLCTRVTRIRPLSVPAPAHPYLPPDKRVRTASPEVPLRTPSTSLNCTPRSHIHQF